MELGVIIGTTPDRPAAVPLAASMESPLFIFFWMVTAIAVAALIRSLTGVDDWDRVDVVEFYDTKENND